MGGKGDPGFQQDSEGSLARALHSSGSETRLLPSEQIQPGLPPRDSKGNMHGMGTE